MSEIRQGHAAFGRDWVVKFNWYYGRGQTVFLRSSHGAMVRRLEARSRATENESLGMRMAAEPFRKEIREAVKAGVNRCSLPWEPLITAAPTAAEAPPAPAVVESDRQAKDWQILAEVSAGLNRLSSVCREGPVVIELLFDDAAEDWFSQGLWHGPLYRFDDRAVRLMGKLRKAYDARIQKRREKAERHAKAMKRKGVKSGAVFTTPEPPTDLELMVADISAAAQVEDTEREREYEAIEAAARKLAMQVARVWTDLHRETA